MSQAITDEQAELLLAWAENAVINNPITVEELIDIIKLSGPLASRGYSPRSLLCGATMLPAQRGRFS